MPTALLQLWSGQEALAEEGRGLQLLLQRDAPLRAFTILPNAALWKGNRAFLAIPSWLPKPFSQHVWLTVTAFTDHLKFQWKMPTTPAEGLCQC